MNPKRLAPAILFTMLLATLGCVPSLNPFYTEKDIVTKPDLRGTWSDADTAWTFDRNADGKSYTLTIKDKAESVFKAHLIKLDGQHYLDLFPQNYKIQDRDYYSVHLVPAHTLVRVRVEDDRMMPTAMDVEKVAKMLRAEPKLVAHQFIEHEVSEEKIPLFTAPTADLQKFVTAHRAEIYGDEATTLTRQKN